eukprot:TRINITY_DN13502_c0_g3_i2.p1 TRINITY_DN13502_c0_g3~~TRINITY_DN13502_c0_g3_i2.p1  ORF type:complete len:125 (-),score=29.12 TRINITY_DN13502_c0_g3_i2:362-736(-)
MAVCIKDAVLALVLGNFGRFHWGMACRNETSIECAMNAKPEFDVGEDINLEQVFGLDHNFWFVPLYCGGPSTDGMDWPMRRSSEDKTAEVQAEEEQSDVSIVEIGADDPKADNPESVANTEHQM